MSIALPTSSSAEEFPTPWPSPSNPHTGRSFLRFLTLSQRTSGVVFSTFLAVHLIPPTIVALTGSESSGSGFMLVSLLVLSLRSQRPKRDKHERSSLHLLLPPSLFLQLSRVAYQHPLLEPLLIYSSVGVHLLSSILRRQLYPRSLCPKPTSHSISGFLLTPLLVLHVAVHRILPSSSRPPISSLSPSELDLSYVGYAVRSWPWSSAVTYGALTALAVWHVVGGLVLVGRSLGWGAKRAALFEEKGNTATKKSRRVSWRTSLTALVTTVSAVALFRLSRDAFVSKAMGARIEAVHRLVFYPRL